MKNLGRIERKGGVVGKEDSFFFLVLLAQKERKYNNNTMSVYRLLSLAQKDVHKKFITQ